MLRCEDNRLLEAVVHSSDSSGSATPRTERRAGGLGWQWAGGRGAAGASGGGSGDELVQRARAALLQMEAISRGEYLSRAARDTWRNASAGDRSFALDCESCIKQSKDKNYNEQLDVCSKFNHEMVNLVDIEFIQSGNGSEYKKIRNQIEMCDDLKTVLHDSGTEFQDIEAKKETTFCSANEIKAKVDKTHLETTHNPQVNSNDRFELELDKTEEDIVTFDLVSKHEAKTVSQLIFDYHLIQLNEKKNVQNMSTCSLNDLNLLRTMQNFKKSNSLLNLNFKDEYISGTAKPKLVQCEKGMTIEIQLQNENEISETTLTNEEKISGNPTFENPLTENLDTIIDQNLCILKDCSVNLNEKEDTSGSSSKTVAIFNQEPSSIQSAGPDTDISLFNSQKPSIYLMPITDSQSDSENFAKIESTLTHEKCILEPHNVVDCDENRMMDEESYRYFVKECKDDNIENNREEVTKVTMALSIPLINTVSSLVLSNDPKLDMDSTIASSNDSFESKDSNPCIDLLDDIVCPMEEFNEIIRIVPEENDGCDLIVPTVQNDTADYSSEPNLNSNIVESLDIYVEKCSKNDANAFVDSITNFTTILTEEPSPEAHNFSKNCKYNINDRIDIKKPSDEDMSDSSEDGVDCPMRNSSMIMEKLDEVLEEDVEDITETRGNKPILNINKLIEINKNKSPYDSWFNTKSKRFLRLGERPPRRVDSTTQLPIANKSFYTSVFGALNKHVSSTSIKKPVERSKKIVNSIKDLPKNISMKDSRKISKRLEKPKSKELLSGNVLKKKNEITESRKPNKFNLMNFNLTSIREPRVVIVKKEPRPAIQGTTHLQQAISQNIVALAKETPKLSLPPKKSSTPLQTITRVLREMESHRSRKVHSDAPATEAHNLKVMTEPVRKRLDELAQPRKRAEKPPPGPAPTPAPRSAPDVKPAPKDKLGITKVRSRLDTRWHVGSPPEKPEQQAAASKPNKTPTGGNPTKAQNGLINNRNKKNLCPPERQKTEEFSPKERKVCPPEMLHSSIAKLHRSNTVPCPRTNESNSRPLKRDLDKVPQKLHIILPKADVADEDFREAYQRTEKARVIHTAYTMGAAPVEVAIDFHLSSELEEAKVTDPDEKDGCPPRALDAIVTLLDEIRTLSARQSDMLPQTGSDLDLTRQSSITFCEEMEGFKEHGEDCHSPVTADGDGAQQRPEMEAYGDGGAGGEGLERERVHERIVPEARVQAEVRRKRSRDMALAAYSIFVLAILAALSYPDLL